MLNEFSIKQCSPCCFRSDQFQKTKPDRKNLLFTQNEYMFYFIVMLIASKD